MGSVSWSKLLVFLWGITFVFVPGAYGQMDLGPVIEEHLDSRGGDDRILGLQGYQMRGSISQDGRTLPMHVWWKRPNKFRIDLGHGENATTSAFDGQTAWTVEPGPWGRQASGMSPGERALFVRLADFEGPLLDPEKKGIRVIPDSKIWGDSGYLVEVHRGSSAPEQIFLSPATRLISWEVFHVGPPGFEYRVEQRYSRFRRVLGFAFPHRVERSVDGGSLDAVIDINEVIIGPAIPDSLFVRPAIYYPEMVDQRLIDLNSLSALRDQFRANQGDVRLLAILSPTSSASRTGLLDLVSIMDSLRDEQVTASIIWTPVLETDSRAAAASRTKESRDSRFAFYWDPEFLAADKWKDVLGLRWTAWNVYIFHGPEATWETLPPAPDYWMHQGVGGKLVPTFNRKEALAKLRELLAKTTPPQKKRHAKSSEDD